MNFLINGLHYKFSNCFWTKLLSISYFLYKSFSSIIKYLVLKSSGVVIHNSCNFINLFSFFTINSGIAKLIPLSINLAINLDTYFSNVANSLILGGKPISLNSSTLLRGYSELVDIVFNL